MKFYLSKFISSAICLLILCCCSNDEPTPWYQNKVIGCAVPVKFVCNLLEPADNYDIESASECHLAIRVPREGGKFTFNLSSDANHKTIFEDKTENKPITAYTLYKFQTYEVTYEAGKIPENWPLWPKDYYSALAYMSEVVSNAQSTFDTGWGTVWGGIDPNSITFEISPNSQNTTRQFCIWFGEYYQEQCIGHSYPYALIFFQD
ncbi:MAG: hypothetical protein HDS66_07850 [Bacteroidales bacterium]|nr:hypothetical protein [Bacteroidales bacterium]